MTSLPNTTDIIYTYHRHDVLTAQLQSEVLNIPPNVPCRFLISKGKDGKKSKLAPDTVTIPLQEPHADPSESSSESSDRITIQYPKGATYKLRKSYLLPIIRKAHQIVVSPETDLYRRLCWVHTQPNDAFIEIGCDYGFTSGAVVCNAKLGIDKSEESLEIAKNNYPNDEFLEVDVLEQSREEMEDILIKYGLRGSGVDVEGGLVVAIDINGNRELEAVIECLKWWKPRLVVVKSRSLYSKLVEMGI